MRPRAVLHEDVLQIGRIVDQALGRLRGRDRYGIAADIEIAESLPSSSIVERRCRVSSTETPRSEARSAVDLRRRAPAASCRSSAGRRRSRECPPCALQRRRRVGERVVVVADDRELQALPAAADAEAVGLTAAKIWTPGIFCRRRLSSRTISCAIRVRSSQGASVRSMKPEFVGLLPGEQRRCCGPRRSSASGPTAASICRISLVHVVDADALRRADRNRDDAAILRRGQLLRQL